MRAASHHRYFALSAGALLLFIAIECLFAATQVSYLATRSLTQIISCYTVVCCIALFPLLVTFGIWSLFALVNDRIAQAGRRVTTALVIAAGIFTLADTICYTASGLGTRSLQGLPTLFATFAFLVLNFAVWKRLPLDEDSASVRSVSLSVATLGGMGGAIVLTTFALSSRSPQFACGNAPNIIILSGDGISADRTSLYGYKRDTTPFLRELADRSLVFENAFSNSRRTTSSISSMLTGRSPLATGVFYFPDIFRGVDAENHLPGLLRNCGYKTLDLTLRGIADPYEMNLKHSFNQANGRNEHFAESWPSFLDDERLFIRYLSDEINDRARHLLLLRPQQDFNRDVLALAGNRVNESEKLETVLSALKDNTHPLFANIHLMGTHGRRFFPEVQVFSRNQTQAALWMADFYDDAVLEFDQTVKSFVTELTKQEREPTTLLIVTSDHAINSGFGRIPLLMYWPGHLRPERRSENAQRLDIAPTLLDILSLPKPEWLEGSSLLKPVSRERPIYFVNRVNEGARDERWKNLASLGVVVCNWVATRDVQSGKMRRGQVPGHTAPCDAALSHDDAVALLAGEIRRFEKRS